MFFKPEDVALKELLGKWSIAFSKVLMCHLREDGNVQQEMQVSRQERLGRQGGQGAPS